MRIRFMNWRGTTLYNFNAEVLDKIDALPWLKSLDFSTHGQFGISTWRDWTLVISITSMVYVIDELKRTSNINHTAYLYYCSVCCLSCIRPDTLVNRSIYRALIRSLEFCIDGKWVGVIKWAIDTNITLRSTNLAYQAIIVDDIEENRWGKCFNISYNFLPSFTVSDNTQIANPMKWMFVITYVCISGHYLIFQLSIYTSVFTIYASEFTITICFIVHYSCFSFYYLCRKFHYFFFRINHVCISWIQLSTIFCSR